MHLKAVQLVLLVSLLAGCNQLTPQLPHPDTKQAAIPTLLESAPECEVSDDQIAQFPSPDYTSLWDRLRAGYGLPQQNNARIDNHYKWYARNQRYMARVSERAQRYLFHIVTELEKRQMPQELALLPIVESAFDPFAYSHGRASGMWQFIPATGKNFGLQQNWWYDGRRDVIASTEAALKYLSYLHRRFDGDWLLALAAYNAGEGNVSKAIRRNKRAGKPTDFWSLSLPKETRAYVPQLLALAKVVKDPEAHQIKLQPIANEPYFEQVAIHSQIDLAQAAEWADLDIDELYLLNAGNNRWATHPQGPHNLLLPKDKVENFVANLAAVPTEDRIGWERYRVKSGDSLLVIAKRFNTSVDALKQTNGLKSNLIRLGQMLLIPVATKPAQHYSFSADQRLQRTQNNASGKGKSRKVKYEVQRGDSFWKIARQYKVKVASLARWNGMAPKDPLKPGQKLVIWTKDPASALTSGTSPSKNSVIRKVAYQVKRGDSLARIAGKFNLSVNDIVRWNPIKKSSYIHPGQSLTLFVDVTRVR